jgi:ATP-dependent DNA helicase RecQ
MELVAEKPLLSNLKKLFGFNAFKGQQEEIIQNIMSGNDTFVIMPTGGGKSLCYQLPALMNKGTAIVISPLIALMKNQVDSIRSFGSDDGIAHVLNSSLTKAEIAMVRIDIINAKTKLLYVAPESLTKQENIDFLKNVPVSFYAIDEAHCISEWGHDFRPEYRRIRPIINQIGHDVPVIALTATATPKVQIDIQKNLGMQNAKTFKDSFNRPNLYYELRPKVNAVKEIIKIVRSFSGKSGIIYCLSRKKVEELADVLRVNGIKAAHYHAGLDAGTRARHQDQFLMEDVEVIVATIAFGMGIDKPDVRFVIHYDIPKSLEGYYQETGRGGRDGGEGKCIAFYSYNDIVKLEKFFQGKPVSEQEIGRQILAEVVSYAESSVCRRKNLLHYFGEEYEHENCNSCDNCLNPKISFDGQEYIELLLDAVMAVKEKFKDKHIIHILTGSMNSGVKSFHHDELEIFGQGAEKDEKFWMAVIRQALVAGFLSKDIENFGLLKLSEKGNAYLENPYSFMLTEDHNYEGETEDIEIGPDFLKSTSDPLLFSMLKDLRKKISKEKNLPPFVIFQDPSLDDMAIQYPLNIEELKQIAGVGAGKAMKFGTPFIELIKNYVKENEIERPMDMVVKSIANKSALKVYVIQSIDRKVPFEDIAKAKGILYENIVSEAEAIVASGTKLNIDYYLEEVMDEERMEEIYDYFLHAETDSIQTAHEELGKDHFSEDDLRLVRIKFMSEMGN